MSSLQEFAMALRLKLSGHVIHRNHLSVDALNRPLIGLLPFRETTVQVTLSLVERDQYNLALGKGKEKSKSQRKQSRPPRDPDAAGEVSMPPVKNH
jgi:hypothetical protein